MDIVDMLVKTANGEFGTHDTADDSVRVGCETIRRAAAEIVSLRDKLDRIQSLVGKASIDRPFSQIKQEIKNG